MTPEPSTSDTAFRLAFRRHAAGVAVVTGTDRNGKPVGFTATSLASLAAEPPLATFNMAQVSSAWPAVRDTDRVLLHLLGAANSQLARQMAGNHDLRFAGDHWQPGPHGLPLLSSVPAWLLGRVVQRVPVAGNAVIVVRIEGGGLGAPDRPLLYHERSYFTPGAVL